MLETHSLEIVAVNARVAWNLLLGPDCCGGWSPKAFSQKADTDFAITKRNM